MNVHLYRYIYITQGVCTYDIKLSCSPLYSLSHRLHDDSPLWLQIVDSLLGLRDCDSLERRNRSYFIGYLVPIFGGLRNGDRGPIY